MNSQPAGSPKNFSCQSTSIIPSDSIGKMRRRVSDCCMKSFNILMLAFLIGVVSTPWALADQNDYMFQDNLVADNTIYTAGSEITYSFERTQSCPDDAPYPCYIDHCLNGAVAIDGHIDSVSISGWDSDYYCRTDDGNMIYCEDPGQLLTMFGISNNLVIRGKIKDDTPEGTILQSSAYIGPCVFMGGPAFAGSFSESKVMVTGTPAPEFPSFFLPAIIIIGVLGAVLLTRRTRKH